MKLIYSAFALTLVFGCASKKVGEKDLMAQASAEHNCPPSEISVLNKKQANGGASYQLNICGRHVTYYRVNNSFVEASKYGNQGPAIQTETIDSQPTE